MWYILIVFAYCNCRSGEIGRRTGLKIQRALGPCRFESDLRHKAMVFSKPSPLFLIFTLQQFYASVVRDQFVRPYPHQLHALRNRRNRQNGTLP